MKLVAVYNYYYYYYYSFQSITTLNSLMYNIVLSASDSAQCANKLQEKGTSSACNHENVVVQKESDALL